jgi:hypothetical protein
MSWGSKRAPSDPFVPAEAGTQFLPSNETLLYRPWIPAFAGMSGTKLIML